MKVVEGSCHLEACGGGGDISGDAIWSWGSLLGEGLLAMKEGCCACPMFSYVCRQHGGYVLVCHHPTTGARQSFGETVACPLSSSSSPGGGVSQFSSLLVPTPLLVLFAVYVGERETKAVVIYLCYIHSR